PYGWSPKLGVGQAAVTGTALPAAAGVARRRGGSPRPAVTPPPPAATPARRRKRHQRSPQPHALAQPPAGPPDPDVGKGRSGPPVSCSGLFGPAVSLLACAPRDLNSRPCVCGAKAPEHALRRLKEPATRGMTAFTGKKDPLLPLPTRYLRPRQTTP